MTATIDLTVGEGRYHRQELISWWNQERLLAARVLVVGAGALGNEIVKNLALLGVGRIEVVDMDRIEASNLARCALFRDQDEGRFKAEVVAQRAQELNPDVDVESHVCKVDRLGAGYLRHFDLVVAGLDNREARLWVGTTCRKLGLTWIDGAIEGLRGLVRAFPPEGACYECTLGEQDRRILGNRRSCALLSADQVASGKVPTNVTTAAIVAGIQVQEAVKVLSGRADLVAVHNRAFMFVGDVMDAYTVEYTEDEYCMSHDSYSEVSSLTVDRSTTAAQVLESVAADDPTAVLSFEDTLVVDGRCHQCGREIPIRRFIHSLGAGDGECDCGSELTLEVTASLTAEDTLAQQPFSDFQPAREELVTIRTGGSRRHVAVIVEGAQR